MIINPFESNSDISPDVQEEIEELKKELQSEKLPGREDWSLETKLKLGLSKLKRLNEKLAKFEETSNNMREKSRIEVERKISNLRVNWEIDETLQEIEELKKGLLGI